MEKFAEVKEFTACPKVDMVFVQIKSGESTQEAWARHIKENPAHISADVKIFYH